MTLIIWISSRERDIRLKTMDCEKGSKFTCLPNELVLEIFQYCSGIDVLNAGEAFIRGELWDIISNVKLWRSAVIGPPSEFRRYSKYLGKHTKKLTIKGTTAKKKKAKFTKSSSLTESLISSIRLNCPDLTHFTVEDCVLDAQVIKFSLFPKTLTFLKLANIRMTNLAQMRDAAKASPFYGIKSSLPLLERLELWSPDYLLIYDSLAIIHLSPVSPSLEIRGDSHFYTFQKESGIFYACMIIFSKVIFRWKAARRRNP